MSDKWSNEITIEFLNLYEKYPVIWDLKHINNKNRTIVSDAWADIQNEMSINCSTLDLKKKKESLMSTYRLLKRKFVESQKDGDGPVRPTWFAFKIMDRFLKNVGIVASLIKEETSENEDLIETESVDEFGDATASDAAESTEDVFENGKKFTPPVVNRKKRKYDPPVAVVENNITNETLKTISDKSNHIQQGIIDECALYGQLIAFKLSNLHKRSRLILINRIDNLIFESELKELDKKQVIRSKKSVSPNSFSDTSNK